MDMEEQGIAREQIVRDSLPSVAAGLSGLFLFFALSHALVLPPSLAPTMVIVAGSTSLIFFMLRLGVGRSTVPLVWVHPLAAAMVGLPLGNALLHVYLSGDPLQSTNVALAVIGMGC